MNAVAQADAYRPEPNTARMARLCIRTKVGRRLRRAAMPAPHARLLAPSLALASAAIRVVCLLLLAGHRLLDRPNAAMRYLAQSA